MHSDRAPHLPTSHPNQQDKDLVLARLLQEQENAFMFLGGSSASHRWAPQRAHGHCVGCSTCARRPPRGSAVHHPPLHPSRPATSPTTRACSASASPEAGLEEDEDVALARALQAEEQQELQQRMLAMAGLAGAAGVVVGGSWW